MELEQITCFFKWCTIINAIFFAFTAMMSMCASDVVYKIHKRWFSLTKESFSIVLYSFLALYKIFFFFFNLIPYLALLLVQG